MFSDSKENNRGSLAPHDIGKHMHLHSCSHMDNVETKHEVNFATLAQTILGDSFHEPVVLRDGGLEDVQPMPVPDEDQEEGKNSRRLRR